MKRRPLRILAAAPGASGAAAAQEWPAKPIRIHTMSPAEFTSFYERERSKWAAVVTESGIKLG